MWIGFAFFKLEQADPKLETFAKAVNCVIGRKLPYSTVFLAIVYGLCDYFMSDELPDILRDLFSSNTSLLPHIWKPGLTKKELILEIKRVTKSDKNMKHSDLKRSDLNEEEYWLKVTPPRTKGDLAVRNIRNSDIITFCDKYFNWDETEGKDLLKVIGCLDYIFAGNVMLAAVIFKPYGWLDFWIKCDIWRGEPSEIRDNLKMASDIVKKEAHPDLAEWRTVFYENNVLYGALQPPVPGFDPVKQTLELSKGGSEKHGLMTAEGIIDYEHNLQLLTNIAEKRFQPNKIKVTKSLEMSFLDYIRTADWERSGSSSIGKIYVKLKDEESYKIKKFKSRKNFLLDLYSAEELYDMCMSLKGQDNVALVKSELGKIRIAVASPVEHYLLYSWLLSKTGSFYTQRTGNTLEETPIEESNRMWNVLEKLDRGYYSLPFDYAQFDHQPTKIEVGLIDGNMYHLADTVSPPILKVEVREAIRKLQHSHLRATISTPKAWDGGGTTYPVNGGIMSGLRGTSYVGTDYNESMSEEAKKLTQLLTHRWETLWDETFVRGDDSQTITYNYLRALCQRISYELIGAKGNEKKFGIYKGRSEFLRLECSNGKYRGYACRSVPNIMQRKPWNALPWADEGAMAGVLSALGTISRRASLSSDIVNALRVHLVLRHCRANKINVALCVSPMSLGGLGLLEWKNGGHVAIKAGKRTVIDYAKMIELEFFSRTTERESAWIKRGRDLNVNLTTREISTLVWEDRVVKLSGDDVPDLVPPLRRQSRYILRRLKTEKVYVDRMEEVYLHMASIFDLFWPDVYCYGLSGTWFVPAMNNAAGRLGIPRYGSFGHMSREIHDLLRLSKIKKIKFLDLTRHIPNLKDSLNRIEHTFRVRRAFALDWLLGSIGFGYTTKINPQLVKAAQFLSLAGLISSKIFSDGRSFMLRLDLAFNRAVEYLTGSHVYKTLFCH